MAVEILGAKDEVLTVGGQSGGKGAGNVASSAEELVDPSSGEGLVVHSTGKKRPRKRQDEGLIAGDERLASVG